MYVHIEEDKKKKKFMYIYSVLHIYPFNNFNNRYIERYLNKVLNLIMIFKNGHNRTNTLMKFNCTQNE